MPAGCLEAESHAYQTGPRPKCDLVGPFLPPPPLVLTWLDYMHCTIPSPTTMSAGAQPPTASPAGSATCPPSPPWSNSPRYYSSVGNVATLARRLDRLSTDKSKSPEDLSKTLEIVLEEHELYKSYLPSLAEDAKRAKALLEVFDKVRTENLCYSVQ